MKSTNSRFYLDYNATSPLAGSVKEYLARGDFPLGNPSAIHHDGKRAKGLIRETSEFLQDLFSLGKDHHLFFHSGASEGLNSIVRGYGLCAFSHNEHGRFAFSGVDHSCIVNQKTDLEILGHEVFQASVDKLGTPDSSGIAHFLGSDGKTPILYCHTHVNNETGVTLPLSFAADLKKTTGCRVSVDAVQTVGKIENWNQLDSELDAYTFSGHKFGAMMGVGFSFIRCDMPMIPLIKGGGQQNGLRSGTENVMGIYSLKLALEELVSKSDIAELRKNKLDLEEKLKTLLGKKGEIVAENAKVRNANTIYFIVYGKKADTLLTALDLAGVDVSTGSACSSGATVPSRVLQSMGYGEDDAKSAIRLSFGPMTSKSEMNQMWEKVSKVLSRFLS